MKSDKQETARKERGKEEMNDKQYRTTIYMFWLLCFFLGLIFGAVYLTGCDDSDYYPSDSGHEFESGSCVVCTEMADGSISCGSHYGTDC